MAVDIKARHELRKKLCDKLREAEDEVVKRIVESAMPLDEDLDYLLKIVKLRSELCAW